MTDRDRGISIVELTVTIALIGVLSTALLAGISAVLRNERPTMTRLSESRDQQQLVNYFTQDVQSARPTAVNAGGSCGTEGTSILDLGADGGTRISYRLSADGRRLTRYRCDASSPGPVGAAIAKELGPSGASVSVVPSGPHTVVTLQLDELSGRRVALTATARNTSTELPPPPPMPIGNPLDASGPAALAVHRSVSATLAQLSYRTCAQVMDAQLWDASDTDLWKLLGATTNARLRLVRGKVNLLAMTTARIASIPALTASALTGGPGAGQPLVITVTDAGAVTFTAPNWAAVQQTAWVLWNFPNATSLTINAAHTLHGSILAPHAGIAAASGRVTGRVVAASPVGGSLAMDGQPLGFEIGCHHAIT